MLEAIYSNGKPSFKPSLNGQEKNERREPEEAGDINSDTNLIAKSSDNLPISIYERLPKLLQDACSVFNDPIDRDVFLMGALAVLSGILPNVYGIYDGKRVGANLYLFIVAAAGSGKGALAWVRKLIHPIHQYLREQSTDTKSKMLLIPANNSASGMIEALHHNGERGILMCTEADTLSGALSQDWGNYSDVMRAGFHHEFYEMMRRGNQEYVELSRPHLSILLSGTPAQVFKLIPNAENGLFSRFCFFTFESAPRMKNVFATPKADFDNHFDDLGKKLLRLYERLNEEDITILFDISDAQKARFLKTFNDWHNEFFLLHGKGSIGSIRRLGLIQFRMAMIFSLLRFVEAETIPKEIICTEEDFENALSIIEVLKQHTAKIYSQLSKGEKTNGLNGQKHQFLRMVPEGPFSRADALRLADEISLPRATLDRFLQSTFFEKIGYGTYQKKRLE